jgi:hypothetical protein
MGGMRASTLQVIVLNFGKSLLDRGCAGGPRHVSSKYLKQLDLGKSLKKRPLPNQKI